MSKTERTELPDPYIFESAKLRNEPLVVDTNLEEIKICIWNKVCDREIIILTPNQRLQPSLCDPCREHMLFLRKRKSSVSKIPPEVR